MNIKNTLISLSILTLPFMAFAEIAQDDTNLEEMIIISEKVKDCQLEEKDKCITGADKNYCLVPISCHLVQDDLELESSEYAFCEKSIFFKKGYKNDQERIQACINSSTPTVKQKLKEFQGTPAFQKLYETPENNR